MKLSPLITRNFRLKALATVIATLTWAGVVYAANPPDQRTVYVHVPQDISTIPAQFVLVHPIPDIPVHISGTKDHVAAFDSTSLRLAVGFKAISKPGIQELPLTITNTDSSVEMDNAPTTVQADIVNPSPSGGQPANVAFRVRPNETGMLSVTDILFEGVSLATLARVELTSLLLQHNGDVSELSRLLNGLR